jgi:hypothetical protein
LFRISDFDIRISFTVVVEPRFGCRDLRVERFAGDRLRPPAGGQRKPTPQDAAGGDERQGLGAVATEDKGS